MDMVKLGAVMLAVAGTVGAAELSIQIGSPAAVSAVGAKKGSTMGVRVQDCADPGKASFYGSAEIPESTAIKLQFIAGSAPGSFAVMTANPVKGAWLAVISVECSGARAGAIVPIDAQGVYNREAARFYSHAPTKAEIEAAIKSMTGGSR